MITIKHQYDVDGCHYVTVQHSDFRTYNNAVPGYASGWRKPNYPVPAIPLKIDWYHGKYGNHVILHRVINWCSVAINVELIKIWR